MTAPVLMVIFVFFVIRTVLSIRIPVYQIEELRSSASDGTKGLTGGYFLPETRNHNFAEK